MEQGIDEWSARHLWWVVVWVARHCSRLIVDDVASVGGHFSDINLSSALYIHRLYDSEHVKLEVWSAPGLSKPSFEEAMKQTFKPAKKGISLGPSWTNHWWKVSLQIPSYWSQYERVQFEFDPGCEAMIFTTGKENKPHVHPLCLRFDWLTGAPLIRWNSAPRDHRRTRG